MSGEKYLLEFEAGNLPADGNSADLTVRVHRDDAGNFADLSARVVGSVDLMRADEFHTDEVTIVPPEVDSVVTNAAGDQLTITFSEAVTNTATDASDFTMTGHTLSSFSGSGTTWTLAVSPAVANGDVDTLAYDATTGDLADAQGNALATFSGQAITNNVPASSTSLSYVDNGRFPVPKPAVGSSSGTQTIAGVSFGAPSSDRHIVIAVNALASSGGNISGVVIGGVTATKVAEQTITDSATLVSQIWRAAVPTGTSGDIDLTWSTTGFDIQVDVYRLTHSSGTPNDTGLSNGNVSSLDLSLNVAAGGVLVATACNLNGEQISITGATQDNDNTGGNDDFRSNEFFIAASVKSGATAETPRTVTANWTGTFRGAGVSASWNP